MGQIQNAMNRLVGTVEAGIGAIAIANKNTDIEKQEEANKMATNKIEARKTQSTNFKNRIEVLKVKPDPDTMQVFKGGAE